jgi:hypothetical protein
MEDFPGEQEAATALCGFFPPTPPSAQLLEERKFKRFTVTRVGPASRKKGTACAVPLHLVTA